MGTNQSKLPISQIQNSTSTKLLILIKENSEIEYHITNQFIEKINCTVREILYSDLPECVRTNAKMVDALLESICTASHTLGYIVKYALASGWLKYDENTSPAIGAYFYLP